MITKKLIDDTMTLCDFIARGKENKSISTSTYTRLVGPKLKEFKTEYLNSPNLIFQNKLIVIEKQLGDGISHKNLKFLGFTVNSNVWATLYARNSTYKNSIQLFIIAFKDKIKFGLGYGVSVNNESSFVKFVKENETIKTELYNIIQSVPNIILSISDPELTPIKVNSAAELGLRWSSRSTIEMIFKKGEVPEDAKEIIDKVLNKLSRPFSIIAKSVDLELLPIPEEDEEENEDQYKYEGPLNVILYGPPGTGKTYNSIDEAVQIAALKQYTPENHLQNKKVFDDLTRTGRIEFITFHQNYSYEDFMVGIRPKVDGDTLAFKKQYGIFYEIAGRAKANYDASKSNTEPLKNFVLVIDEINRANISKVFGELITLIEDDKRLGEENELKVKLTNGEDFGVPPNLYIIGTMNTADKSIALVDIALRRRFEFKGYYPSEEFLNKLFEDYKISNSTKVLIQQINENILKAGKSTDYLIGHAYFIKRDTLMNDNDISTVLEKKIIPLLLEYFSGNADKVIEMFKNTSWTVSYDNANFKWIIPDPPTIA